MMDRQVAECMTPWSDVCCVAIPPSLPPSHPYLPPELLPSLLESGFTRVPVYQRLPEEAEKQEGRASQRWLRGYVYTKPKSTGGRRDGARGEGRDGKDLRVRGPLLVSSECPLLLLLEAFQQSHAHIAVVVDTVRRAGGRGGRRATGFGGKGAGRGAEGAWLGTS
jgi:CBS domain containing-hemolysin-like protein